MLALNTGDEMRTWAKVGLVFITIVVVAGLARGKPEMSIRCSAKGDSGSCQVENKGGATGDFAADVVLVCRDGEHVAHVAERVEAHNHVTKIIDGFNPGVGMFTTCAGIDYRNMSVK
jgi:hypothetical protein